MQKIFTTVLSSIRPSKGELENELQFSNGLVRHIRKYVPSSCQVVLTGSMAKRTFLRDKKDVDIFILFKPSVARQTLEHHVKTIMHKSFPSIGYQLSYAEHPYIRFHYKGRRIDLVPAYQISKASERISAVDRSVLHTKFVHQNLKKSNIGDVLLLKKFLVANSLYGAEIKTQGFSGYLCELMIIRYNGFSKLIRAASKWKQSLFIDLKNYHKTKKQIITAQDSFGEFVVIDPTDANRNVAAAVSQQSFRKFIALCKAFVKKPSTDFFFRTPETFDEIVSKLKTRNSVFVLYMPRPDIVDDVLWGQLNKLIKQLGKHLEEFKPKKIFADDTKHIVRIAIVLSIDKLPGDVLLEGPPLDMKKHVQMFRKSHKKAKFIKKNKKIYAKEKRSMVKAESTIRAFFRTFSNTDSHLAYPEEMILVEKN